LPRHVAPTSSIGILSCHSDHHHPTHPPTHPHTHTHIPTNLPTHSLTRTHAHVCAITAGLHLQEANSCRGLRASASTPSSQSRERLSTLATQSASGSGRLVLTRVHLATRVLHRGKRDFAPDLFCFSRGCVPLHCCHQCHHCHNHHHNCHHCHHHHCHHHHHNHSHHHHHPHHHPPPPPPPRGGGGGGRPRMQSPHLPDPHAHSCPSSQARTPTRSLFAITHLPPTPKHTSGPSWDPPRGAEAVVCA
jgi:hypothetical protein